MNIATKSKNILQGLFLVLLVFISAEVKSQNFHPTSKVISILEGEITYLGAIQSPTNVDLATKDYLASILNQVKNGVATGTAINNNFPVLGNKGSDEQYHTALTKAQAEKVRRDVIKKLSI
jgi:hypothetical protein